MSQMRQTFLMCNSSGKFQKNLIQPHLEKFRRTLCSKPFEKEIITEKSESVNYMVKKLREILHWYEEFSGLKEVRLAQDKVVEAGEKLAKVQEERRLASLALSEVQKKLKEIYAELEKTKRGDDRYVYLITEEHKFLREEEARQEKFRDAERAERDQFNILSNSVKNSHEKERTQAEKTKYWSIIGSVIGTILGIIGTSINNYFRMAELKKVIQDSTNGDFKQQLEKYLQNSEKLAKIVSGIHNTVKNSSQNENSKDSGSNFNVGNGRSVEELLDKVNSKLASMEESVRKIENTRLDGTTKFRFDSDIPSSELLVLNFNSLSESIQTENKQIKSLIITACILSLIVPLITKVFSS